MQFPRLRHLAVLAVLGSLGQASAQLGFASFGAIDPNNGFPRSYLDTRGVSLDACLNDPVLCGLDAPVTLTNPGAAFPLNFAGTFPEEFFYNLCSAKMPTTAGQQALLVIALEAAFLNGPVAAGEQITFGRVRIRIGGLISGQTYRATTPVGVFTFVASAGTINSTDDIGGGFAGDFTTTLSSHAGPFLRWDTGLPIFDAAGREYIGNPAVDHTITGSPSGTNFFRVQGPNVGGAGVNTIQTNLFSVIGLKTAAAAPPPPPPPPAALVLGDAVPGVANQNNTFTVTGVTSNAVVFLIGSVSLGSGVITKNNCRFLTGLSSPTILANTRAVGTSATFRVSIGGNLAGVLFNTQALDSGNCSVSNVVSHRF